MFVGRRVELAKILLNENVDLFCQDILNVQFKIVSAGAIGRFEFIEALNLQIAF